MKILVCSVIALLVSWSARCQSLIIKSIEIKANRFVIYYSLQDSIPGNSYTIRAFSSADGFITPLQKTVGDVGLDIKPGANKRVEWPFQEELPASFEGKLAIELRARIFTPFIKTESINQYKLFKRARNYNLTWSGGSSHNVLTFDLYRGDRKVFSFPNIGNSGHHTFNFPSHLRPANNYRFRISDSKNADEVVYTTEFKIKRRVPLILKSAAALGVGASIYLLLMNDPDDSVPDLPGAPRVD